VLPRFICQDFSDEGLKIWMEEEKEQFIKILMRRLNYNKFDGIVFECGVMTLIEDIADLYENFIRSLYLALNKQGKLLIITIYPYSENFVQYLTKSRFESVSQYVDYFHLMTYDYFSYQSKEYNFILFNVFRIDNFRYFNSPFSWIEQSIEHYIELSNKNLESLLKKILLGVPFYGANTRLDAERSKLNILDGDIISEMLKADVFFNMVWNENEKENIFYSTYEGINFLGLYPTKNFIKERLSFVLENKLGGVGIWELSQGLDKFYDEF